MRPYSLASIGAHEVVALGVVLDPLDRLAGVLDQQLVQLVARPQDLLGVDVDVGRLALRSRRAAGGSGCARAAASSACPWCPAASRNAPIDAACPMQNVATSRRTYCMVS